MSKSFLPALLLALGVIFIGIGVGTLRRHPMRMGHPLPPQPAFETILSSGTIGEGGSLSRSLTQAGVPAPTIAQIERTLKPDFNPRNARPGDRYELYRSTNNAFVRLAYWPSAFESYTVSATSGAWAESHANLPLSTEIMGASGEITDSLWDSMTQQGIPPDVIYRFADIFAWRIDFLTEPRQGDTYKLVWKRFRAGGALRDGDILAAYYNNKGKGELYAFPFEGDYYDQNSDSMRGEFLRAPLAYRRISSRFTNSRFHPILRIWRPHHGIDYSAARGTPVQSIADGLVVEKGYKGGLGNEIKIRHRGGYSSIYGHLQAYAKRLRIGGRVRQGETIGFVGSTGLSTGPHLHFGFEENGRLVDFMSLRPRFTRQKISSRQRGRFETFKRQAMTWLGTLTKVGGAAQLLGPAPSS